MFERHYFCHHKKIKNFNFVSYEDLFDKYKVGNYRGAYYSDEFYRVLDTKPNAKIVPSLGNMENFNHLLEEKIDIFFCPKIFAQKILSASFKYNKTITMDDAFHLDDFPLMMLIGKKSSFAIFISQINAVIEKSVNEGEMEKIINQFVMKMEL